MHSNNNVRANRVRFRHRHRVNDQNQLESAEAYDVGEVDSPTGSVRMTEAE